MPNPLQPHLAYFVREAFPSVYTGTTLVEGRLKSDESLHIQCEMNEGGVVFGDGMETDNISFGWGQRLRITTAAHCLNLVQPAHQQGSAKAA